MPLGANCYYPLGTKLKAKAIQLVWSLWFNLFLYDKAGNLRQLPASSMLSCTLCFQWKMAKLPLILKKAEINASMQLKIYTDH